MPLPLPPAELIEIDDEEWRLPPGIGLLAALGMSIFGWGVIAAVVLLLR